jgi:hypothetical protein
MRLLLVLFACGLAGLGSRGVCAADPTPEAIRSAIGKSLPLLERGARGSIEQRKQCFNCHNQGLPILALTTARERGFPLDEQFLQTQLQFTADFLAKNKDRYLEGKGQGGQVDMAGYALWTLAQGGWQPDDTTAAVAEYLLLYERDENHWKSVSRRPPSEQSPFTTTYLALRGLQHFGMPEQRDRIAARTEVVREWLLAAQAKETEDFVFRLHALKRAGASEAALREAAAELLKLQRDDGGWAQLPDLESDAYATGSALTALQLSGGMKTNEPAYHRGLAFLLAAQQEDGSWHVVSRSKPFQAYFETGYPHGKDQFISSAAGGWATIALALALPTQP